MTRDEIDAMRRLLDESARLLSTAYWSNGKCLLCGQGHAHASVCTIARLRAAGVSLIEAGKDA